MGISGLTKDEVETADSFFWTELNSGFHNIRKGLSPMQCEAIEKALAHSIVEWYRWLTSEFHTGGRK